MTYTYNAAPTVTALSPNNGPVAGGTGHGDRYRVRPASTTVDFGSNAGTGVTASVPPASRSTVPAGTGSVSVSVSTTGGGTSTPNGTTYTYNATPTVTAVSPNNGPAAGGTRSR